MPANVRCHEFWHQHHGKSHRIGNELAGRQTGVALAAYYIGQMLHRHARNARNVFQSQATLVPVAANGGRDEGVHGGKFRWRCGKVFIASYEFANLVNVKFTDPSAQFLPAAAPPSPVTFGRRLELICPA